MSVKANRFAPLGLDVEKSAADFHKFFIDTTAGVRALTDAARNPAFRHLPEDDALNLLQPVDQEEVISLITSLPSKQCRSDLLPT